MLAHAACGKSTPGRIAESRRLPASSASRTSRRRCRFLLIAAPRAVAAGAALTLDAFVVDDGKPTNRPEPERLERARRRAV